MEKTPSVHEAETELLGADEAIVDAERMRTWFHRQRAVERVVPVRVPFWALLEVIDAMEPDELRQTIRQAEDRLATIEG